MKTLKLNLFIFGSVFGLFIAAAAQTAAPPADEQTAPAVDQQPQVPAEVETAIWDVLEQLPAEEQTSPPAVSSQATPPPSRPQMVSPRASSQSSRSTANGGGNLAAFVAANVKRSVSTNATGGGIAALNFQNVPLQQVLEHLSCAAGFVINSRVPVTGRITLITPRPLSQQEVVNRLNEALSDNGYGALLQDDGTLKIDTADNIKRLHGPVLKEADPAKIPNTEQLVTQVLPIKYVDASQLVQTLQPLVPQGISLHVNSAGNSIVVQDTQSHIHRMAEIIKVLDTSLAAAAEIKVYALKYADAKSLATIIQGVFQSQSGRTGGGPGGGGPGGMADIVQAMMGGGGGRGGGTGNANQQGRITVPPVTVTSDDRANAVIVSAAADQMALVDELVAKLDINIDDLTIVQVFKLSYADPAETVTELSTIFPVTTSTGTQQQQNNFAPGGFQFGGGPGGGPGGASSSATAQTDRSLKQTQVIAVADSRTSSVIVIASKTLMPEIAKMIGKLDADRSGEMQMFSFDMESMDPSVAQQILEALIPAPTGASTSRSTTSSAIFNRSSTGSSGSTGLGTSIARNGGGTTGAGGIGGSTTGGGGGGAGLSDRNQKANFASVDSKEVLAKVVSLPITTWNYKVDLDQRHLGPMAQDFYGAFGIGQDDKTITFLDEGGVALAAIQGLNQKLEDKDAKLQALEKEVSELKALVQSLVTKFSSGAGAGTRN